MRRVPYTGAEKESLWTSLDRHRDAVLWKLDGLDDEQLRRRLTPSGVSLLGLVKHLAVVEYGWFCDIFGGATEPLPFDTWSRRPRGTPATPTSSASCSTAPSGTTRTTDPGHGRGPAPWLGAGPRGER